MRGGWLVLGMVWACAAWGSGVYKWVDEKGVVHFSERPPAGRTAQSVEGVQGRISEEMRLMCGQLRGLVPSLLIGVRSHVSRTEALKAASAHDADLRKLGFSDVNLRRLFDMLYNFSNPVEGGVRLSGNTYYATDLQHEQIVRAQNEVHNRCVAGAFGTPKPTQDSAPSPQQKGGTGFFVAAGLIATNWHVVENSERIEAILDDDRTVRVELLTQDRHNDLAILRVRNPQPHTVLKVMDQPAGLGANVFTVGFPQVQILGAQPKLATGVISSLSGLQDDATQYQISVPVQSGNSGGPLVDGRGQVVGVVAAKLNAAKVYRETGDLPQNVSYAVKSIHLHQLLQSVTAGDVQTQDVHGAGVEELAPQVQSAVVRLVAY